MRPVVSLLLVTLLAAAASAQAPTLTLTGGVQTNLPDGEFGEASASVPDADGDGVDDLLVGAGSVARAGFTQVGQAYLFSGASGTLLRTLDSPNPETNGYFGFAVSGVPDLDGDGRGDLLVGAYNEDVSGVNAAGRVYVFSGATGALLRTVLSPNPESDGRIGISVAGVPDADGDGRGDILAGAYFEDGGATNAGRAYLFSGASGALLRTFVSPNAVSSGFLGRSVAGVPDADGDGVGDLLVSADSEDGGATNAGRAYLFSGATGTLLHTLNSPNPSFNGGFGRFVSGVPDADGDGRGDLLVGAWRENGGATASGRAFLFSGATGALLRTLVSPNPETSGSFGQSVSGVPDADGDGRGDLLVGAFLEDGGPIDAGRAYLFSGATGALLRTLVSDNPESDGVFGWSVAGVSDVNGDGRGDLLVGARDEDGGGVTDAGRAYLVSGDDGAFVYTLASQTISPEVDSYFGLSVAGVPDADGDGRGDLLVGAWRENGGATDAGRAYLFSGATGALLRTLVSPNPETSGSFGQSVAGVPDADGDGRGDLLVGAWRENGGASIGGRAYLFSGATGALLRTLVSDNPESDGVFGRSVAGVSDVNGDGRGDLLVGARDEDGGGVTDAGRAYLFSGATGALLRTLVSPNPETSGSFGQSVAGVPDADGDGRGDLLVGAWRENGGATDAGRAYLFSGATGALLRTLESPNPETSGYFGFSVAGVPDADGDGRGDLLVGAYRENGGATEAGRAYLVSGATGALLRTLESPNPETAGQFGQSVAGVPDADGDGRGDLLVGAYSENGGATNAGRAYLFSGKTGAFYGSPQSPNPATDGRFGYSVAGVPDADGDGRGDLLVGAYLENGGAINTGRAYLIPSAVSTTTLPIAGPEGWHLVAPPYADLIPFTRLLGPVWTQGALGAGSSDGDPVVYAYDEALTGGRDAGFVAVPDLRAETTSGQGYAVYVFEDDDPFAPGTQGGFPKTLSLSGPVFSAAEAALPVSFTDSGSLQEDGWNLVGNPFDAFLDWDAAGWTKTGLDNVIYVWDAPAGVYRTWNGSAGSLGDGLVPPYTGFWVKAVQSGAALVAPAGARTETPPPPAPLGPSLALRLSGTVGGVAVADAAFLSFVDGASEAIDPFDAYELAALAPISASLFTTPEAGPLLDIDARGPLAGEAVFGLGAAAWSVGQSVGGAFTLSWPDLTAMPEGWALTLTDTETGETVDLRDQASYAFTLTPEATLAAAPLTPGGPPVPRVLTAASRGAVAPGGVSPEADRRSAAKAGGTGRFVLRMTSLSTSAEETPRIAFGIASAHPNPTREALTVGYGLPSETDIRLSVFDALGREVAVLATGPRPAGTHTAALNAATLAPGIYIVRLSTNDATDVRRITIIR